ncbi:MAG: serine/threonine protein kinase, partial [Rhodanobacteraceae bacterium]|nr:serine/threonine protein kinase [Rhodanobacteraceae bacterium]
MGEPEEPATDAQSTRVGVASLPSYISGAPRPDPLSSGPAAWVGRQIDDYRILRVIGAGGMGVVFLAQQRHPKRMVAIKTLHAGLHQADLLARFQQEAEILGRLKHPGIAQIYSSGRTDASLGAVPYIVMEFVEGAPLLEFCNKLDTRARLQLLMRVCEAVEHAHIRGVIHRDLKPGNILVQADGLPKVLDFGVARLTGEEHGPSELTSAGMVIGTIAFMSPEQALGEPGGVDIRTDVYALGMIGYRMLTGEMPYEVTSHNLGRALQQICESAPTPLSRHDRRYAGDLETIFHKVLAKDKDARYQNAAELAEDLRRYLADEAILARRASVFSDVRRFARRNKVLVGAAAMVLLSLVGAVMVSTRFALDEQAQRLQADVVVNSMRRMLSGANPVFAQGEDVPLRAWIEQGEQQLQRDLTARQPHAGASARRWQRPSRHWASLIARWPITPPPAPIFSRPASADSKPNWWPSELRACCSTVVACAKPDSNWTSCWQILETMPRRHAWRRVCIWQWRWLRWARMPLRMRSSRGDSMRLRALRRLPAYPVCRSGPRDSKSGLAHGSRYFRPTRANWARPWRVPSTP